MFQVAVKMKHVLVQALTEDMPKISLALAEVGVFDPNARAADEEHFPNVPGKNYRDMFRQANARLEKIGQLLPLPPVPEISTPRVVDESELERLNAWLGDIWSTASSYEEKFRQLADEERLIGLRESALENFANLNVDLGLLHGESRFLSLFIGTVPSGNLLQLEEALKLEGYMSYPFLEGSNSASIIIVGQQGGQGNELRSVLQAAAFQPLAVPPDLRSQPEKIREEIRAHREELAKKREKIQSQLDNWGNSLHQDLANAQRTVTLAAPFASMDKSMRSIGSLGVVTGWVPAKSVEKLEQTLNQRIPNPFLFTVRNPTRAEREQVPTLMPPIPALTPFQDVVKQYGVPGYGEIDPTYLFTITFVIMFGAMFGDVGQGAVIAGVGLFFRKSLGHFVRLVVPLGISSMIFGVLYGSVFGYEDVLFHHVWVSPLHYPSYMLSIGILWGVGFITIASIMSIYNHFLAGEQGEAIFGHHGIMSVILYLAVVAGLIQIAQGGTFGWIATVVAVCAISAISGHAWHELKGAPAIERFMVALIGAMEIFMGYISNTLSFLRVAAFSVNHAALALAVFAIANVMDTTGYWVTVVFGNIFMLVLEGGIVAIQTLRLEYYEGFSRYYSGDGHDYEPITLNVKPVAA